MRLQRDGRFTFEPVTQQKSTNDVSKELVLLSCVQNNTFMRLVAFLTHETPKLPLYRNQSIDLLYKSIDWFLYDGNFDL